MGEDLVDAFLVNFCDHTCCSIFLISCFNNSKLNKVMLRISCFFKGIQKKLLRCKIAKCLSRLILVKHSAKNYELSITAFPCPRFGPNLWDMLPYTEVTQVTQAGHQIRSASIFGHQD